MANKEQKYICMIPYIIHTMYILAVITSSHCEAKQTKRCNTRQTAEEEGLVPATPLPDCT